MICNRGRQARCSRRHRTSRRAMHIASGVGHASRRHGSEQTRQEGLSAGSRTARFVRFSSRHGSLYRGRSAAEKASLAKPWRRRGIHARRSVITLEVNGDVAQFSYSCFLCMTRVARPLARRSENIGQRSERAYLCSSWQRSTSRCVKCARLLAFRTFRL
jgi:hypothetical protein